MSTLLLKRLVIVVVGLIGWHFVPSQAIDRTIASQDQRTREELLRCALLRTKECRALLDKSAQSSPGPTKELASALVEEWPLDPADPRFEKPRLVWADLPGFDELAKILPKQVRESILLVRCEVQPDGSVSRATLVRKSEVDGVNRRILEAFNKALFRPSRSKDHYVQGTADLLYRVEPR